MIRDTQNSLAEKVADALALLKESLLQHGPLLFANSLGAEDMVLTDLIWQKGLNIDVASIDTGRLPVETLALMTQIEQHYGQTLVRYTPEPADVSAYVSQYGLDGFYDSVDARKACCQARKVIPLRAALKDYRGWVTGIRSAQSPTRTRLKPVDMDPAFDRIKINPLTDWSEVEVWEYLKTHHVPYNPLHDQNYPSIGCAPCTRAVAPGEDLRAGRWWWETPETKECGLHLVDGRLQRRSPPPSEIA